MSARVLVVDDVLPNVKLLEARLSAEYFNVQTAYSGPEALAKAVADPPDIVLLDVMMPGMDGFEVCRRLKAEPRTRHVPVVMVTALSAAEDRVRGLECGADDFLTKPVRDLALYARIRSLVRLKMLADEWRLRSDTSERFGMPESVAPGERDLPTDGARVCVVDELPGLAKTLEKALAGEGAFVELAGDAAAARAMAESGACDAVLVNTLMRKTDGLRLCAELRASERARNVPLLAVLDDGDEARLAKALDLGVTDYLLTPIESNELVARVRTQIRRKRYIDALRANYERNMALALTDELTGLHNRRYMEAHLGGLLRRALQSGRPLTLLVVDIDLFKNVNDTYGHLAGDDVLRAVANRLQRNLRPFDTVARWGGEEFLVAMPDADRKIGLMVAERLRAKVAENPIELAEQPNGVPITISVGVASAEKPGEDLASLMKAADEALYRAKQNGRNRIESA
ncbi:MAG: PleD family two-component system response regulator [Azospirillum sp.]|nr:PleD family two-component system response regulator [Azospirillum sp.]MCA3266323.1 PleD family two-component system response regulator [Azospirillum sp.]MCZ8124082.1 PleD family two-component system response regulator [Magnetospirillum sp.]